MPTTEQLERRIAKLEALLAEFYRSDRYLFPRDIELSDTANIRVNSKVGAKIALSSTDKLGFFGATPVSRQSGAADLTVVGTAQDGTSRATINVILTALENLGLIETN